MKRIKCFISVSLYDIEDILDETPDSKQTMLFSATMPKDIKKIGEALYG
ncbi:hypothetical protein ACT7CU_06425 [Bacillus paranthracis]